MRSLESALFDKGFRQVVGIDEAGRGPLAGPVLAAAVQVIPEIFSTKITDSKQLSPKKRLLAYEEILSTCGVGIGIASVEEIDSLNILGATFLAMRRALDELSFTPDFCLVDGSMRIPSILLPQEAVIKGDSRSISIAAASIVAKVERDKIMEEYDRTYPVYNFKKNKGYGTKEHREAIQVNGRCPIHRTSFRCASL